MKKFIIIILAVLLVGGGAAYYFLVFQNKGDEEKPAELYSYVPGSYFVTNVKDSSRLFKVTVVLALNTKKLEKTLKKNEYLIRDTIIFSLRELTEKDILDENIGQSLREDLTRQLNELLEIDNIVTVYFNDFVMQ